jgi:hypothetical protein
MDEELVAGLSSDRPAGTRTASAADVDPSDEPGAPTRAIVIAAGLVLLVAVGAAAASRSLRGARRRSRSRP